MSQELAQQFADLFDGLAKLFDTRALIARRRGEDDRARAYSEAARETRSVAAGLRKTCDMCGALPAHPCSVTCPDAPE